MGIGGVLIMDVDQGRPPAPGAFADPQWRELFRRVCSEAARLGLEVNMTNDAGWDGSGGPWITPALSMQKVVWTETALAGPRRVEMALAQPEMVAGYYRDIAVVAFPTPAGNQRIEDIKGKSLLERHDFPAAPASYRTLPARANDRRRQDRRTDRAIQRRPPDVGRSAGPMDRVAVRPHLDRSDKHARRKSGEGLECDKLNPDAADAMFAGLMAKLVDDNRPLVGKIAGQDAHR